MNNSQGEIVTELEILRKGYEESMDVITDDPADDNRYRQIMQMVVDDLNELLIDVQDAIIHKLPVFRLQAVRH